MAKSKTEKPKLGRPTEFNDRLVERLLVLAKDGATDAQLAKAAHVAVSTLKTWKGRHPDFQAALKDAKCVADDLVEASLFRRACGYSHRAIKFFCHEGTITWQKYTEHYPPDTTACIYWLKNRRPERWREQPKVENLVPFVILKQDGGQVVLGAKVEEPAE